jgi:MerR family copper efflux transcriptional regulator
MRIGELTERSGVPSTALRYYEQVGRLPAPSRTASGYRATPFLGSPLAED